MRVPNLWGKTLHLNFLFPRDNQTLMLHVYVSLRHFRRGCKINQSQILQLRADVDRALGRSRVVCLLRIARKIVSFKYFFCHHVDQKGGSPEPSRTPLGTRLIYCLVASAMPDQFCSRLFDILRENFAALPTIFCWAMLRFTDVLLEFCSALLRFVGTLPDAMASTRRSVYIRVRVVDL